MKDSFVSRREIMLAGGAASVLTASVLSNARNAASATLAVPEDLRTNDPQHNLIAYMKILSDLSGGITYRYHTGRILSVAPGQLGQPFLDFIACKQDRVRQLSDGSYQHGYRGVILFTELDTGRVLDTFDNPLTGETNTVQHFKTVLGSGVFTTQGAFSLASVANEESNAPGLEGVPFQLGWNIVGDDVWVTYDERVAVSDNAGKLLYADSSMYRYYANMSQLKDPSRPSADTVMSWDTETTWWDWMGMTGRPGHLIFGSMGRKYGSVSDIPANVIAAAEQRFPGQLTRPIDWADYTLPADLSPAP